MPYRPKNPEDWETANGGRLGVPEVTADGKPTGRWVAADPDEERRHWRDCPSARWCIDCRQWFGDYEFEDVNIHKCALLVETQVYPNDGHTVHYFEDVRNGYGDHYAELRLH